MTAEDAASRRRRLRLPLDGAAGKLHITAQQENRRQKHTRLHLYKKKSLNMSVIPLDILCKWYILDEILYYNHYPVVD